MSDSSSDRLERALAASNQALLVVEQLRALLWEGLHLKDLAQAELDDAKRAVLAEVSAQAQEAK